MRQIGTLQNESDANRFGAFLLTLGIDNTVEPSKDAWDIWVENDDHLDKARAQLDQFLLSPAAPQYDTALTAAKSIEAEKELAAEKRRKNFIDVRTRSSQVQQYNIPLTMLLLGVMVMVGFLTRLQTSRGGDPAEPPLINILQIAPYFDGHHYEYLNAIFQHGEIWRLITPIFLHDGLLHIIFNLMVLADLGGLIESRRGTIFFVLLVLATAIVSNLAQYYWHGPGFGGMSGVNYGLFGYAWIKGRLDPMSNIGVRQQTTTIMLVWLVACMTGYLGPVANMAHFVGMVVGIAFAYIPHLARRLSRR
jgi:GlpG protein